MSPLPPPRSDDLSTGQAATLACLLEVAAPKPGNVHRGADFDDATFEDFLTAAVAIQPALERAAIQRVGQTILDAIVATRNLVQTNCNLGIVLLLAPLAAVPRSEELTAGLARILEQLNEQDAADIYQAIRLAEAGGLGEVEQLDIHGAAPPRILEAMQLAADRDDVARQYVTNFRTVFEQVAPWLRDGVTRGWSGSETIVHTHVRLMAAHPDTLIARKCGGKLAEESALRAQFVLDAGAPGDETYHAALADLDFWLRSDGRRRNPGTTADLIAAGLFVLLRDGRWFTRDH